MNQESLGLQKGKKRSINILRKNFSGMLLTEKSFKIDEQYFDCLMSFARARVKCGNWTLNFPHPEY